MSRRIVGLVPARGGSKGIPRKNLAPLGGRPLLRWTIDAAKGSSTLTDVVVSTDDDEIAAAAEDAQVLRRPSTLAADETPMREVVLHALDELEPCEVVVLLQPTSPLRRSAHIDEVVNLLLETGADSVVTVTRVPHRFAPESLLELVDGRAVPLTAAPAANRRQDKAAIYARNGPAILAVTADAARRHLSLYDGDCRAYVMTARDSIDIDEPADLKLAELLLRDSDA